MLNTTKIQFITNREQLIAYLSEEKNSYSNFILERINRDPRTLANSNTQAHHIIPSHRGGPDQIWNMIKLTLDEHGIAHQLLYENYNTLQDLGASQMIRGQLNAGLETIRKIAQETMKKNKKGFYSSDLQSELGKRPKNRQPYARNEYIIAALLKGFNLEYTKTGQIVNIKPSECSSLVDVINKLMSEPQMENEQKSWDKCIKKEKHYSITALTRTLTGHIDKQTGKSVYSFMGWRVLGINLFD